MNCRLVLIVASLCAHPALLVGQEADRATGRESKESLKLAVPLRVVTTVSRFEGAKKVASLPYALEVAANDRGMKLRMGVEVPVPVTTFGPGEPGRAGASPSTSYQYRNVGTNIDCRVEGPEDGRFRLHLTIEQSSLPSGPDGNPARAGDSPRFRTFSTEVVLLLKPGQTTQFVAATDPVTGESVRIDVALELIK